MFASFAEMFFLFFLLNTVSLCRYIYTARGLSDKVQNNQSGHYVFCIKIIIKEKRVFSTYLKQNHNADSILSRKCHVQI